MTIVPYDPLWIVLAIAKAEARQTKAYERYIKKLERSKKPGRPDKLKTARIEAIAKAELEVEREDKSRRAAHRSLHALFDGSGARFRSFLSRHRVAIDRAKRNGGHVPDGLPHLPPPPKQKAR